MRVASYIKVTQEMIEDKPFIMSELTSGGKRLISDLGRKGLRAYGPTELRTGWCNEDFATNLITVSLSRSVARVPRIFNTRDYKRKRFINKWRSVNINRQDW